MAAQAPWTPQLKPLRKPPSDRASADLFHAFEQGRTGKQPLASQTLASHLPFPAFPRAKLQQVTPTTLQDALKHCVWPTCWQETTYFALHAGKGALSSIQDSLLPYFFHPWGRYTMVAADLLSRQYVTLLQTVQFFYEQRQSFKMQHLFTRHLSGTTHVAGIAYEQNNVAEILQQTHQLHLQHTQLWRQLAYNIGNLLILLVRVALFWRSALGWVLPLHGFSMVLQFIIRQRLIQPIQRQLTAWEIDCNNNIRRSPILFSQGTPTDFQSWWQQQHQIRSTMGQLFYSQQAAQWLMTAVQSIMHVFHWYALGWLTLRELTPQERTQAMSLSLASNQLLALMVLLPRFWQDRRHLLLQMQTRAEKLAHIHSCSFPEHIQYDKLCILFEDQAIDYPTLLQLIATKQKGHIRLQAANGVGKTMLLAHLQQAYGPQSLMLPVYCQMIRGDEPGTAFSSGQRTLQRLQEIVRQLREEPQLKQVHLLLFDEIRANLSQGPRQWLDKQMLQLCQQYLIIEVYHQPELEPIWPKPIPPCPKQEQPGLRQAISSQLTHVVNGGPPDTASHTP